MNSIGFEMEDIPEVYHHTIWAEKYRPTTFDAFIGSAAIKETLKIWMEKKDIPHLFLYGSPGGGKTSLAKILVKKIPCDALIINASDENSIDDIRNKVQEFAMTMGMQPLKIVVLDECLDESTLVMVLRDGIGLKLQIKDLLPNTDLVRSFNFNTNRVEWMPFLLMDKGVREVYSIQLDNGETVICTGTHKWYVKDMNGNVIKMMLDDIIKNNISEILTV